MATTGESYIQEAWQFVCRVFPAGKIALRWSTAAEARTQKRVFESDPRVSSSIASQLLSAVYRRGASAQHSHSRLRSASASAGAMGLGRALHFDGFGFVDPTDQEFGRTRRMKMEDEAAHDWPAFVTPLAPQLG